MIESKRNINEFLVEVFHDILKTEETALMQSTNKEITIKEFHLLETVTAQNQENGDNTAGNIALEMHISAGSLTIAVKKLEAKGYLKRKRDAHDKRSVHIIPTAKGMEATERHQAFHGKMISAITDALNEEETLAFQKGLNALSDFFREVEQESKK